MGSSQFVIGGDNSNAAVRLEVMTIKPMIAAGRKLANAVDASRQAARMTANFNVRRFVLLRPRNVSSLLQRMLMLKSVVRLNRNRMKRLLDRVISMPAKPSAPSASVTLNTIGSMAAATNSTRTSRMEMTISTAVKPAIVRSSRS